MNFASLVGGGRTVRIANVPLSDTAAENSMSGPLRLAIGPVVFFAATAEPVYEPPSHPAPRPP
ncbi:MAG: hypothetical protein K2Y10_01060, partial [Burkholderiaceae bacterium]|nr:hypothetical protein [Burkholderiaceae bacterium]